MMRLSNFLFKTLDVVDINHIRNPHAYVKGDVGYIELWVLSEIKHLIPINKNNWISYDEKGYPLAYITTTKEGYTFRCREGKVYNTYKLLLE